MSDYATLFPPQTYSSSFYINALAEGDKTTLVSDTDDDGDSSSEVQVKNSPILDCFISTMKNSVVLFSIVLLSVTASDQSPAVVQSQPQSGQQNQPQATQQNQTQTDQQHQPQAVEPSKRPATQPPIPQPPAVKSPTPQPSTNQTKECVEDKSGKIRSFSTLTDYQGNKFSFDPRHRTYQGNIVRFSFLSIDRLVKNSFIAFGSDSVMMLDLHNKSIQELEAGAFMGLFCLKKLDLSHNNLTNLSEGSFQGLGNLDELNLSFNHLQEIPDNGLAFVMLKRLKTLDLSYNKIKSLNKLSFVTLNDLEVICLGHNKIRTIDPRVFNYLDSLKQLYLNDNLLDDTAAEQWKSLLNLTDLDFSNNYLSSFDMSNNYSFTNLKNLNLSGNHLQHINVYGIRKHLPNLFSIDLSNNSWLCEDLEAIRHGLKDSKITIPRYIDCSEVKTTSTKRIPTETTEAQRVTTTPIPKPEHEYGHELLEQNKEVLDSNTKIAEGIQDLKNVLVCLFIVFLLCVAVETGVRLGVCRSWYHSLMGRSGRGYLDSNDVESVGLISR